MNSPQASGAGVSNGLILGGVIATLAAALFGLIIQSGYPFVLASAEARASLEVTAAQLAELKSARLASDCVAFAMLGGFLAASVSSALTLVKLSRGFKAGWGAASVLIFIGLIGGAIGAILATWFDESVDAISDPTMRSSVRSLLLLVPPAVAVAVAVAVGARLMSKLPDILLGAIVGVVIALALQLVLHGTLTAFEASPPPLPERASNRWLLAFAFLVPTALSLLFQVFRAGGQTTGVTIGEAAVDRSAG